MAKSPTGIAKVGKAPAAFGPTARQSNAIVEYLSKIVGRNGINVKITEAGIVIEYRPPAAGYANKTGGVGTGTGSGGGTVGATTQAVGSAGQLIDVVQPTSPNAAANYPSLLRAGNVNANSAVIDSALITHQLKIQTFAGCNNGNAASYQTLASDMF